MRAVRNTEDGIEVVAVPEIEPDAGLGDEQGAEAFYNFAVTPAFMITADLQVTDSAKEGIGTAVIGALRATLRF